MNANALLVWMRRPLPDVAAGAPLCVRCGINAAVTDDGELTACMPCIYRAGDRARRPVAFDDAEVAALEVAHQEVAYVVSCRQHRLEWMWTRSWPSAGNDELISPETAWRVVGDAYLIAARSGL